jgi:hypothetical protein
VGFLPPEEEHEGRYERTEGRQFRKTQDPPAGRIHPE